MRIASFVISVVLTMLLAMGFAAPPPVQAMRLANCGFVAVEHTGDTIGPRTADVWGDGSRAVQPSMYFIGYDKYGRQPVNNRGRPWDAVASTSYSFMANGAKIGTTSIVGRVMRENLRMTARQVALPMRA